MDTAKIGELAKIAKNADYEKGLNAKLMLFRYESIKRFIKGSYGLEVGPAGGLMTRKLVAHFKKLHVVEPVEEYAVNLGKIEKVIVHNCLFEDWKSNMKFDTLFLCHVLEHVEKPIKMLLKAKTIVKKDGVIIVTVPNANSFHRHIGVKMGLLKRLKQLNETDQKLGHKRVYFLDELKSDISKSGLKIIETLGFFVKFLSNKQMEDFDDNLLLALYEISNSFKENCSSIGCICKPM